eukprot:SAG25_NODE_2366_length_1678_cov_7.769274_2_plen_45_part_00
MQSVSVSHLYSIWSKRLAEPPHSLAVLAINIAETPQLTPRVRVL